MKKILSACLISAMVAQTSFAIDFTIDSVSGAPASQVIIPVRVVDFDNIIGIQGSIQFDVNVISYSGVQQFGLPGMTTSSIGITQIANGKLTYLWDDNSLEGPSLADGTIIFEIVFNVVGTSGQQSSLCFVDAPTPREVIDSNFNTLTGNYVCGNLQIPGGSNPVPTVSKTDITCFGADDGSASVSVSGGTSPYTYSWSNGAMTASIANLSPGPYSVTVTDAGSTTASGSVTISEPSALTASASSTAVTGCGISDGTATVSVSGGIPSYSYSWSNGGSTVTINSLQGGTYNVTVTDGNNCMATDNVTVSQPSSITANISSPQNVSCFGLSDGAATASGSGGLAPYTYSWSNNASTAMISSVPAATYTVTVEDANNCVATNTVTITQPNQLMATASANDITCFGNNDGSATVTVSGGTPAYTYSWTGGGSTATISNLSQGAYNVTVSDDNGCSIASATSVTEPTAIVLLLNVTDASVFGSTDGAIDLSVTGGITPYTYNWSNGSSTQDVNNLAAGDYIVNVSDANGCAATDSATVDEPVSVRELNSGGEIKISPNPNNGNFEVTIEGINSFSKLEILNPLGQVVYTLNLNSSVISSGKISVSASLEKGTYITRLSDDNQKVATGALLVK